jgi:hypothetical protein
MKTICLLTTAALLALAVNLHSQGVLPKTPIDKLKDLKAKNAEIIEKQGATLQKLDDIEKQSEQLRFFSKRS